MPADELQPLHSRSELARGVLVGASRLGPLRASHRGDGGFSTVTFLLGYMVG